MRGLGSRLFFFFALSVLLEVSHNLYGEVSLEPENVLINASFEEEAEKQSDVSGWKIEGSGKRIQDSSGTWRLKLSAKPPNHSASASQIISLPEPLPSRVTVALLVKASKVRIADEETDGFLGVRINFFDAKGNPAEKSQQLVKWDKSFGLRPWAGIEKIPQEAEKLELVLELNEIEGDVFFDEVELFFGFPDEKDRINLVAEGGFDHHTPLSPWLVSSRQKILYPGFESRAALGLDAVPDGKSATFQELVLDKPGEYLEAELGLVYALQDVRALKKGGGARVEIEFRDAQGKILSTKLFGPWTGNRDWTPFKEKLKIPGKAHRAFLRLIMENASGSVRFDEIRISAFSRKGPLLRSLESLNDVADWKVFEASGKPLKEPLDAGFLLDPPAGHHGFLRVGEDGHFYFQDGTRARFFGINIQAPHALPTHEEAEAFAQRLSQWGFNLVRLHHLDAPWAEPNIFDQSFDDTQHLSADNLDRLDYFIAQLKSRGIYVYLDLLVSRKFKKGDQVRAYIKLERGAKEAAQFNRRLIELQKKYAQDLLTHRNPYTRMSLVDDPALVMTEIINESTLCRTEKRKFLQMPSFYLEELKDRWVGHLASQGVEAPELQGNRYLDFEDTEVQKFYASLQRNYFLEMRQFLRDLGLKIPVAGSNLGHDGLDLETNAELDFIDRHAYWDHPMGGYGDLVRFNNSLMIHEAGPANPDSERKRINFILKLARLKVKNKPFVVGEWNVNWPNEYRAIAPLLMAAYASFQDWDAVIQFNFEGNLEPSLIQGNFDVSNKPEIFFQYPAAARLFHQGDVRQAETRLEWPIFEMGERPYVLGLRHGLDRTFEGETNRITPKKEKGYWVSDTKELKWNQEKSLVLIETPRIWAALGLVGGVPLESKGVRLEVETPFAAVSVASLDGQPVPDSKRLLLTAVSRSENTGTIYNATRTVLRTSGVSPIRMEPVVGSISLALNTRPVPKIFVLDEKGNRLREITAKDQEGSLEIPLGEGFLYELLFEGFSDSSQLF